MSLEANRLIKKFISEVASVGEFLDNPECDDNPELMQKLKRYAVATAHTMSELMQHLETFSVAYNLGHGIIFDMDDIGAWVDGISWGPGNPNLEDTVEEFLFAFDKEMG